MAKRRICKSNNPEFWKILSQKLTGGTDYPSHFTLFDQRHLFQIPEIPRLKFIEVNTA
jgi:hypothetical protein